jgi:hypothetical protein
MQIEHPSGVAWPMVALGITLIVNVSIDNAIDRWTLEMLPEIRDRP